jgi:hypothetical protein
LGDIIAGIEIWTREMDYDIDLRFPDNPESRVKLNRSIFDIQKTQLDIQYVIKSDILVKDYYEYTTDNLICSISPLAELMSELIQGEFEWDDVCLLCR